MCSFGGKKKKKNPEDERKILYRNIKKKMATSGQLWSTRKKRVPTWIKFKGKEKSHWVESNPIWKTLPCRSLVLNFDSFSESSWMRGWGPTRVGCGAGVTEMGGWQHLGLSTPAVPQNWAGQSPQPEAVPGGGGPPCPGGPVAFMPRPARARHLQCLSQGRKPDLGRSLPHSPSEKCSLKTKICHSCLGQGFLQPPSGCGVGSL